MSLSKPFTKLGMPSPASNVTWVTAKHLTVHVRNLDRQIAEPGRDRLPDMQDCGRVSTESAILRIQASVAPLRVASASFLSIGRHASTENMDVSDSSFSCDNPKPFTVPPHLRPQVLQVPVWSRRQQRQPSRLQASVQLGHPCQRRRHHCHHHRHFPRRQQARQREKTH